MGSPPPPPPLLVVVVNVVLLCVRTGVSQTLTDVYQGADSYRFGGSSTAQEGTTEHARHLARCHGRMDAARVWRCRLDDGVETAFVRPNYRATELVLSCESDTPGQLGSGLFRRVSDIQRLEIKHCGVTRIEGRALHSFVALRHLSLRSSSSELTVSKQAFHHLRKLESVDLSGSHIEYLPRGVFCHLHRLTRLNLSSNALVETELGFESKHERNCGHALQHLDLSFNALRSVRARSFARHASLQNLSLAGNRIERLAEHSFSGTEELRELDLRENRLVTLPGRVLTSLRQLNHVWLQRNRLSVLPPLVFAGLDQLVRLNLSANQLTSPGDFAGLPRLLSLDLSHNRLIDLLPGFRQLNSLQLLDLSHNQVTHLPPGALVSLSSLFELDLSHNRLVRLSGGSLVRLQGLTVLRLDHNQLVALLPESLSNCSGVQRLLLSHNQLVEVPVAIQALSLLYELDLAHNRLLFVEDDAFRNLSSLLTLNLSHNKLTNLTARAMASLASLRQLDLSYNELKSLKGILNGNRQLTELNLAGNKLTDLDDVANNQYSLRLLNVSGNVLAIFDYSVVPPQLRQLDVSNNRLLSLSDKDGPSTIELQELDASGNQITKVTSALLPDSIKVAYLANNSITDVESKSFFNKTHLQLVDLSGNQLRWLKKISLHLSVGRAEVRLAGNPLLCDCHSEWLLEAADDMALTDLDRVLCTVQHRGRPVQRPLADTQFLCSYQRHCFQVCRCCDYDACDCEQTCPQNCTCLHNNGWTSNIIMCADQGMTLLPNSIPIDATDIMLDGNDLERLHDLSFLGHKKLKVLFLNNSNLMWISNRTFQGLTSLQDLHLENNQLTRLEGGEMTDLTGLRKLYLQNNQLQYINLLLFKNLEVLEVLDLSRNRLTQLSIWTITQPYLVRVSLAGNSWQCECSFRFRFRRWLLQNLPKVVDADAVICSSGDVIVTESECRGLLTTVHSSVWVYVATAAVCLAVTAAVLVFIVCRRLGKRNASPHKTNPPLVYDMFVSCDAEDTALASQLAAELPYLRLCLLHQDVAAVPDAIMEAVHASSVTVLLLTNAFVGRAWCRFDFKHAHMAALGASRCSLLLVDVDNVIGAPELDPDLVMLAKTCAVLSWRDKQLGQRLMQVLRPPPAGWRAAPLPDDCSDGPVYASIGDDDLTRSPSTALSEKAILASPPRMNITVNHSAGVPSGRLPTPGSRPQWTPPRGGHVQLTPSRAGNASLPTSPGGKVQLTPSYFV